MIIEYNRNISVIKKKIKVTSLKLSLKIHGGLQSLARYVTDRFYLNSALLSIARTEIMADAKKNVNKIIF